MKPLNSITIINFWYCSRFFSNIRDRMDHATALLLLTLHVASARPMKMRDSSYMRRRTIRRPATYFTSSQLRCATVQQLRPAMRSAVYALSDMNINKFFHFLEPAVWTGGVGSKHPALSFRPSVEEDGRQLFVKLKLWYMLRFLCNVSRQRELSLKAT